MPIKPYLSSDSLSYIGYIFIRGGGTILKISIWFLKFYFTWFSFFKPKLSLNCVFFLGKMVELKNLGLKWKKGEIDGDFKISLKSSFYPPYFFGF